MSLVFGNMLYYCIKMETGYTDLNYAGSAVHQEDFCVDIIELFSFFF